MSRQRSDEVIKAAEFVTIGELVRLTGMRYSTIKFYSELGIIPCEQKDIKLTKYYNRELTVKLLNEIKHLREKGLCWH
uniref:MerR family transcriptional regulator n=1 Tax=Clostridium sp. NkU-1 TaxID=1095009 RepID=UPI003260302C